MTSGPSLNTYMIKATTFFAANNNENENIDSLMKHYNVINFGWIDIEVFLKKEIENETQ